MDDQRTDQMNAQNSDPSDVAENVSTDHTNVDNANSDNVVNYKCPNCSAGLSFDSKTQKMTCKYCGSSYTIEELEEQMGSSAPNTASSSDASDGHWEGFKPQDWSEDEKNQTVEWNCPSCGAQMVTDKTQGAAICPYCDNPMVMPTQFSGSYRPDYVIPFKKDKNDAIAALKIHYAKKPLLPRVFKDQNHLEEVKSVYVPFWLFDLDAYGKMQFNATRTRIWSDMEFNYTETSFYHLVRAGNMSFTGIPVDGSKKIDDTMMESIEPYNYSELKDFDLSYLSGYMANKYDEEPDELTERVNERMGQSMKESLQQTVYGYNSVIPQSENIQAVKKGKVKYGLLPVWFLNTKWNGQDYSFAMNGQTGKLIGNLPVGKDLAVAYWMKINIPVSIAAFLIFMAIRYTTYYCQGDLIQYILYAIGLGIIFALCGTMFQMNKMKSVRPQEDADSYVTGNGLNLTDSRDMFLYRNVTRTPRQKNNNQGGGGHGNGFSGGAGGFSEGPGGFGAPGGGFSSGPGGPGGFGGGPGGFGGPGGPGGFGGGPGGPGGRRPRR